MKALVLARVSSKDQEEGQSIPAQVRRLTEYALKKNLQIDQTFQVTESSSKETRKQFEQILSYIKNSKEPIALVTDTVDRLQRSFRETPILDELRRQGKLELHFLRESLIINKEANSAALMQWDIGVLFASSYIRQLSDNVKRSKDQSTRSGQWTAKAPFGYKNVTLASGQKNIEIEPSEAALVKKMFELYSTGTHSFQTITDEMTRLGMRNSKGRNILSNRIEITLKNTFYSGVMRMNGELYPHKYPPIISEELFEKVQNIIYSHHKTPVHYAGKEILFRGLIKCAKCGCTVTGYIKKGRYVYYSCNNAKKICEKILAKEEAVLAEVLRQFDKIRLTDKQISNIITNLKHTYANEQEFFKHSQDTLRKELDHIQVRLSKLIDAHLDGVIKADDYRIKLAEYKKKQQEIMSEMKAHVNADESCLITAQTVLSLAQEAREIFESSNMNEKQQLLNFMVSNFKLNGKKLDLELKEPFSVFAKIGDQPEWLPLDEAISNQEVEFDVSLQSIQTVYSSFKIQL